MRESESGVILFITYYYGRGGGSWEIVKFLLSIRLGWGGGGGGGGEELRYHCAPSPH